MATKLTTKGPRLDTERISEIISKRDAAVRKKYFISDAAEKMRLQDEINQAQKEIEAIKKAYDTETIQRENNEALKNKYFGKIEDKLPPLVPLGNARRGIYSYRFSDGTYQSQWPGQAPEAYPIYINGPGGYGAETIMTNKPAVTQQELEDRAIKYFSQLKNSFIFLPQWVKNSFKKKGLGK